MSGTATLLDRRGSAQDRPRSGTAIDAVTAAKRARFRETLRRVIASKHAMTNEEIAAMFDNDGDLGSAMRAVMLNAEP